MKINYKALAIAAASGTFTFINMCRASVWSEAYLKWKRVNFTDDLVGYFYAALTAAFTCLVVYLSAAYFKRALKVLSEEL